HSLRGESVREAVSEVDNGNIGKHHAESCTANHADEVVETCGQRDGRYLSLIPDLRQKERDHRGAKDAHRSLGYGDFAFTEIVGHQYPTSHYDERRDHGPVENRWA